MNIVIRAVVIILCVTRTSCAEDCPAFGGESYLFNWTIDSSETRTRALTEWRYQNNSLDPATTIMSKPGSGAATVDPNSDFAGRLNETTAFGAFDIGMLLSDIRHTDKRIYSVSVIFNSGNALRITSPLLDVIINDDDLKNYALGECKVKFNDEHYDLETSVPGGKSGSVTWGINCTKCDSPTRYFVLGKSPPTCYGSMECYRSDTFGAIDVLEYEIAYDANHILKLQSQIGAATTTSGANTDITSTSGANTATTTTSAPTTNDPDEASTTEPRYPSPWPWWAWLVLAILILVVLLVIILPICYSCKRCPGYKENNNDDRRRLEIRRQEEEYRRKMGGPRNNWDPAGGLNGRQLQTGDTAKPSAVVPVFNAKEPQENLYVGSAQAYNNPAYPGEPPRDYTGLQPQSGNIANQTTSVPAVFSAKEPQESRYAGGAQAYSNPSYPGEPPIDYNEGVVRVQVGPRY